MSEGPGRRAQIFAAGALIAVAVVGGALWLVPDLASRVRQLGSYASSDPECLTRGTPCVARFPDGGTVTLTIEPEGLPTETPLTFRVHVDPPELSPRAVELQGVDMNMGLLRFPLDAQGVATGTIPICTTTTMRWKADVILDDRTAGFGFTVTRAHNPVVEPTYPPFTLTSSEGPLGLADFEGQVVAVYFGYTTCPDFCPMTLQTLARARALLPPDQQERVVALMVSLDPERDSPEHLASYTSWFDESFRGVTGDPVEIATLAQAWGVSWRKVDQDDSELGYTLDHDTRTFLVAPDGHMVGFIRHGTEPESIARQMASLL
ncbi:MAG: SCO family protein [Deltaproteobacteria bacterium]|nr:MAG: SCO family protein [Deltaproteobacteria bacterium]